MQVQAVTSPNRGAKGALQALEEQVFHAALVSPLILLVRVPSPSHQTCLPNVSLFLLGS